MRSLITVWAQAEHMLWRGTYQSTSLSSKLCKQQWQWHRLSSWVATARDNFAMLSLITVWAQVENISDNGNPAINIIDNTEASLCDNNVGYNNGLLIHCVTVTWRRLRWPEEASSDTRWSDGDLEHTDGQSIMLVRRERPTDCFTDKELCSFLVVNLMLVVDEMECMNGWWWCDRCLWCVYKMNGLWSYVLVESVCRMIWWMIV